MEPAAVAKKKAPEPVVAKSEPREEPPVAKSKALEPAVKKSEPRAAAPAEPAVAKSERVSKPAADKPRMQKAAGVRMHKGVPLLD